VIVTSAQPLCDGSRVVGLHLRLLEIAGRPANLSITAFRAFAAAMTVDFLGQELAVLRVEDGKIKLDLAAHEWTAVDARWA
jgi:hypothetical protein